MSTSKSISEVEYQSSLAQRLGYLSVEDFNILNARCEETAKVISGLIRSLRKP